MYRGSSLSPLRERVRACPVLDTGVRGDFQVKDRKIPIVLVGFGTTTAAVDTYSFIGSRIKGAFPDHTIQWAYSSRMVRDFSRQRNNIDLKSPRQVLCGLAKEGHTWALVQSIHLLCGHEFYRLVEDVRGAPIRTSVGLPLLHLPRDYERMTLGVVEILPDLEKEAAIFIGHGTDHPSWASYIALERWLQNRYGGNIHVGMVEGADSCGHIVKKVKGSGVGRVLLIPLMIVAGVHFHGDIMGDHEDSWKSRFEKEGIRVLSVNAGIGYHTQVVDIFIDHIKEALDVIPLSVKGKGFGR